ncbi:MAG: cell division protein FtsZ [Deltaproteobacteria bacterium]|nr:MAG: cell division protein FtsZ [Deltaproteobacteria bacterium]
MAEEEAAAKIKVVGVGGGGGNAINTMISGGLKCVDFIAANTDKQAIKLSLADVKLQLGPNITKGLGAGADPEIGSQSAHESIEEIKDALIGADMVFVTAGLGGGTGTGAAPVVAKVARELGALTVAVVNKPFGFEGKLRTKYAEAGWQELRKHVDSIITVPNDRLLTMMQKNSKLDEMLRMADSVLLQAVKGISDLINVPGIINADFADLRRVMKEVGPAIMGIGSASGEDRSVEAAKKAIDNQLLEDVGISGAKGLLINISASKETLCLPEYAAASNLIQEQVDDDAIVVLGCVYDDNLGDELQVTVIATGVGDILQKSDSISRRGDLQKLSQSDRQNDPPVSVIPARPNNNYDGIAKMPRPDFTSFENLGDGIGSSHSKSVQDRWKDDKLLEIPAYLRKKAN